MDFEGRNGSTSCCLRCFPSFSWEQAGFNRQIDSISFNYVTLKQLRCPRFQKIRMRRTRTSDSDKIEHPSPGRWEKYHVKYCKLYRAQVLPFCSGNPNLDPPISQNSFLQQYQILEPQSTRRIDFWTSTNRPLKPKLAICDLAEWSETV